jgi:hypothetical protein
MTAIRKDAYRHPSENYAALREAGLAHLEALGSDLWTDYNAHDPGITLLELLAYAITDLGYRTSFPVRDLLARPGDDPYAPAAPIYTARTILVNNPQTLLDWRKLLVDIEGVRNAWLFTDARQEVDFYADCAQSTLEYFEANHAIDPDKLDIGVTGSAVLASWIEDPANTENDRIVLPLTLDYFDPERDAQWHVTLQLPLPGWTAVSERLAKFLQFVNADLLTAVELVNRTFDYGADAWQADLRVRFQRDGNPGVIVFEAIVIEGVDDEPMRLALESVLTDLADPANPLRRYRQALRYRLSRLSEHTVYLRGLYDVLLEYEIDDELGDLNTGVLSYRFHYVPAGETELRTLDLDIDFAAWREVYPVDAQYRAFIESGELATVTVESDFYDPELKAWYADLHLQYAGQGSAPDVLLSGLRFRGVPDADAAAAIRQHLEDRLDAGAILGRWLAKLQRLLAITDAVEARLHTHRNLCEDFRSIAGVCTNTIGVCADIDLATDAVIEEVQAEIFFQIEQYFSPPVQFYTLREMVDAGRPSEDIFNGPPLEHGFIEGAELARSDISRRRRIYTSDIVNLLMDIPGVTAVRDVLLTKYDCAGTVQPPSKRWCVELDDRHVARLGLDESKFLFFKTGLPYVLRGEREARMLRLLDRKRAAAERPKLSGTQLDFPAPTGRSADWLDYTPLRENLPEVYGVGPAGLPENAGPERRAQARQLKTFLAFYDQLLVNYLGQLGNLRNLLGIQPTDQTYYPQFLTEAVLGEAIYADAAALEDAGPGHGPQSLQRIFEDESLFLDRRNRLLDHLLARFAEQFTDYALLVNDALGNVGPLALIGDKIDFLQNYPRLSRERGKGFNYRDPAAVWDTDNVTGLQQRAGRLLGIGDVTRRDLHCPTIRDAFTVEKSAGVWTFRLESGGSVILRSTQNYPSEEAAFNAKEEVIARAYDATNYDYTDSSGAWRFEIGRMQRDATGAVESKEVLAESEATFADAPATETGAADFRRDFTRDLPAGEDCTVEGLHVVEHLLLRPRNEYIDDFFEVCLPENCFFCGEDDPYSFRASVILPYWMERFTDRLMKVRTYADELLRREAPAHVHLKICWVDNEQLRRFEVRFRRWLDLWAERYPDPALLSQRLNALLRVLGELRNVYPEGFLHDCDDSEEEATIVLGKSFLGTLRPPPESAEPDPAEN